VHGHQLAVVFRQPTGKGRANGCWIPPVVALGRFYGLDTGADVESVLARYHALDTDTTEAGAGSALAACPELKDEAEDVFEVFEQMYGLWAPSFVWGDDQTFLEESAAHGVPWRGPTSADDYGTQTVHTPWFDAVRATVDAGDLVLLLVERLEGGKDKGGTHYLLVVGYQETRRRRGGNACSLQVKDPMEGNQLLAAVLWNDQRAELTTQQVTGSALDRFKILESTHTQGLRARLRGTAKGPPVSDSTAADTTSLAAPQQQGSGAGQSTREE